MRHIVLLYLWSSSDLGFYWLRSESWRNKAIWNVNCFDPLSPTTTRSVAICDGIEQPSRRVPHRPVLKQVWKLTAELCRRSGSGTPERNSSRWRSSQDPDGRSSSVTPRMTSAVERWTQFPISDDGWDRQPPRSNVYADHRELACSGCKSLDASSTAASPSVKKTSVVTCWWSTPTNSSRQKMSSVRP